MIVQIVAVSWVLVVMRVFELVTRWMGITLKASRDTTVQTSNGFIVGHEAPNTSKVIEYLGIPYAQPPIGDLRFAAPVAYAGNARSTLDASEFVSTFSIKPFISYVLADIWWYSQRI